MQFDYSRNEQAAQLRRVLLAATRQVNSYRLIFLFMAPARPVGLLENLLAQSNRLRRDFDQLIVRDPFQGRF
jgi:hypothetical protein